MLHKEAVEPDTLELIYQLQNDRVFDDFILVGGTALALHIGHRLSVDIDLFTRNEFPLQDTIEYLEEKYGFQLQFSRRNTLKGIINGVFVDFIRHNYDFVEEPFSYEGLKIASKPDIAAMKVNAITGNGTRIKDFIDIYFLLQEYDFAEIIEFYKVKYANRNDFHAIKSLTYFNDVITEEWPQMYRNKNLTFRELKDFITSKRDQFFHEHGK